MSPSFRISLLSLAVLSLFLAGCVSVIPEGKPAVVYVASNGMVTFQGTPIPAKDLPQHLIKAGAKPTTHIKLIVQGEVPDSHVNAIVMNCGKAGLPSVTIQESMRISVTKGKQGSSLLPTPNPAPKKEIP